MSIEVTNHTKYPGRAIGTLWSTVLRKSYYEALPKGRGRIILAEKEATAAKLGARITSTHDAIVGRFQRVSEYSVHARYSEDNSFSVHVRAPLVHVLLPHKEVETARALRRMRFAAYAELLGDHKLVPSGIADRTWSTVDAAAQTFPKLMKKYGEQLTERQPKPKAPKASDPRAELATKLASVDAREKAWRTKAKRAATALKNIERERKKLQRKLAKLDAQADAVLAEARP